MTDLKIRSGQFPEVLPKASVGDRVTVTVTGWVVSIEQEVVDISTLGEEPGSHVLPGERITTVAVRGIEVAS